ncbi:MAG: T9SS type A sorting domain-containing protein [Bacteroidales bacterium]|nr:T9SS type A sorting domain-containing protein [Bacteroidales bacterium]
MKRINFIFTISLLFFAWICNAQITKSAADTLVLNALGNDLTIRVYGMSESINRNVSIYTADGVELTNPYDNSYVYFIDDMPSANWAHRCRYCFVNVADGNIVVVNQEFYPDNSELFERINQSSNRVVYFWPYTNYTIPTKATPNSKLYAVLIAGNAANDDAIKSWYNLSCVYTTLVNKYGFMEMVNNNPTHIFVIAPYNVENAMLYNYGSSDYIHDLNQSGDFVNICDFLSNYGMSYSKYGIKSIFDNLSGYSNSSNFIPELTEDDQLFVFICGDAQNSSNNTRIILDGGSPTDYLYDYELANWVRDIKCSQMTFLIDCNNAGGFIDDLMDPLAECKNRAIHTSTDQTHKSWVEKHLAAGCDSGRGGGGGNDNRIVDEYVYYWAAASLGYYPILELHYDFFTGPWYKYENTGIGLMTLWGEFYSFNEGNVYSHTPYDVNPNTNNDGVLSMEEAFIFADNLDTYSHRGYFNPKEMFYYNTSTNTYDSCVEYPCHAYESSFTKELVTLDGYKGKISNDAETGAGHEYLLAGAVIIDTNKTLTVNNNTVIRGNNQLFTNKGTMVTNSNNSSATFHRLGLANYEGTMSMSHCVFDTCGTVNTTDGPFSITNSLFNQTSVYAKIQEPPRESYNVVISNDTFDIASNEYAIRLRKIPQCVVTGNTITTGGDGIYLDNLAGLYTSYNVSNNTVSDCDGSGIVSYASNGTLTGNTVTGNGVDGLESYNLSDLHVTGNSLAFAPSQTQHFTNNSRYQVHASNNSYPSDFHFNWFSYSGSSPYYMVFYESNYPGGQRPKSFDITSNCWYPLSDANIPSHLLTSGNIVLSYLPTWSANGSLNTPDRFGTMFDQANGLVESGDYDRAWEVYVSLIEDHPESPEAIAAMKILFSLARETGGDFSDLKDYYLDKVSDVNLGSLADNLANRCDVELGNYSEAIGWYEDKIMDPDALYSERIFAEIDLGDLYLMMADNGIKGVSGKMPEYVPVSEEAHAERTRHLLSLLPGDMADVTSCNTAETAPVATTGVGLMCSPNPASGKVTVSYAPDADGEISMYDVHGNEVRHIRLDGGSHSCEMDVSDMPAGLYFCSIRIEGKDEETIKIIINH